MFDFISNLFFKNSGKRIQNLAMVFFIIQSVAAIIAGVIFFIAGIITIFDGGIMICLLSPFAVLSAICVAWLDSIFVYGFGELIENTSKETENDSTVLPTSTSQTKKADNKTSKSKTVLYHCAECGKLSSEKLCEDCKNRRIINENDLSEFSPCHVCGADVSNDGSYCHVCNAKLDKNIKTE
ncbi:MAG: hypothetical protein IKU82_06645 [Clostridia bacterium]|nr:hypothetical protein [Clostridia bacterium]